jgi:hypothetical protein
MRYLRSVGSVVCAVKSVISLGRLVWREMSWWTRGGV